MWLDAITKIRDTAKWLIAVFAAVGGLLVGTAPLAGLQELRSWRDGAAALAFFLLALTGVAIAVRAASNVLLPASVDLKDVIEQERFAELRDRIRHDPQGYLGGFSDAIEEFWARRQLEITTLRNIEALLVQPATEDEARELLSRAQEAVTALLAAMDLRAQQLLRLALYQNVQAAFRKSWMYMLVGAVTAALGVFGFMAVAGSPTAST